MEDEEIKKILRAINQELVNIRNRLEIGEGYFTIKDITSIVVSAIVGIFLGFTLPPIWMKEGLVMDKAIDSVIPLGFSIFLTIFSLIVIRGILKKFLR